MKKILWAAALCVFFSPLNSMSSLASINVPKQLNIITRAQWGANEAITFLNEKNKVLEAKPVEDINDPNEQSDIEEQDPDIERIETKDANGKEYVWPLQYAKDIKFIIMHHTATISNLDNPKTAIQNIEYYHAVRRGWGDIGYNYIIDTQGKIYEGRKGGERVIAGHAKPLNKVSIGIAVLGNYEENEMPAPVLNSLLSLIAEKAKLYKINIGGKTLYNGKYYDNIQGHFENSPTLCPGKALKQKLDGIKTLLAYNAKKQRPAEPPQYSFNDFQKRDVIVVPPDQKKTFTVKLQNSGTVTWGKNTFLENMAQQSGLSPAMKLPKILARLENANVKPGGVGLFKGEMASTLFSGLRVPEAGIVINGSIRPSKSIPIPIMVEGLDTSYEVIARSGPPAEIAKNKTVKAWIKLKNTGNFTWKRSGKNPVSIGASNPMDAPSGRSNTVGRPRPGTASGLSLTSPRLGLKDRKSVLFDGKTRIARLAEKEVKPGETGTFIFIFKTPNIAGSFKEYFQPVVEGVTWLENKDLNFKIIVKGIEKPIRVALGFKGKPEITSSEGMKLYEGKTLLHTFGSDETATAAMLVKGGYIVRSGKTRFTLKEPPRFKASPKSILEIKNYKNNPSWSSELNDNMFRGMLEIRKVDSGLVVINELPLEDYLKGIAEISNGDPKEKIKTIIILARSYAKYYRDIGHKFPGKPYDLDDDPDHTQKYVGYGLELRSPNIVSAVEETTGQIVTYQNKQIITPYFSQSSGRTLSALEAWGWKDAPYLQSVDDSFCGKKEQKGHGVGLSGCGATVLAKQGKTAEEIIKYYYKGVEITD